METELFRLLVKRMAPAETAVLFQLKPLSGVLPVFG
jgi:hypothetical protein